MIQADRIAFSAKIVGADTEIKGLEIAKASLQVQIDKIGQLDSANKNLFAPVNLLVASYQSEIAQLDGNVRTTVTEQNIVDSSKRVLRNVFFPNDIATSVPSLSAFSNVWTKIQPFALGYGVGLTYSQAYPGSTPTESATVSAVTSLVSSASAFADIENTTGLNCTGSGPGAVFASYSDVVSLKTNLVSAVNALISFLNAESALINIADTDPTQSSQNQAAIANISSALGGLNSWLAFPDFHGTPSSVTTCSQFYSYDPNLLAPTKLHSSQLTALLSLLSARTTFAATRLTQLSSVLGSVSQDITTGLVTGAGLYLKRVNLLSLRLNALAGSLSQVSGLQAATGAQDTIKATIIANKDLYLTIIPTSAFQANANGGTTVTVVDATMFSVGDTVYIYAENQDELLRAVKAINGNSITLNDVVPQKYRTGDKVRMYKDLS